MKKNGKFIVIVLIIIVVGMLCVFSFKKDNTPTNADIENTIVQDKNEIENVVSAPENIIEEEKISEEPKENKIKESTLSSVYEQNNDIGSTDRKQEAINLVKKTWGEDDSVTFRCDSITNSGEYIIAVISKDSARVQNYFKVNLDKKTVEIDY